MLMRDMGGSYLSEHQESKPIHFDRAPLNHVTFGCTCGLHGRRWSPEQLSSATYVFCYLDSHSVQTTLQRSAETLLNDTHAVRRGWLLFFAAFHVDFQ